MSPSFLAGMTGGGSIPPLNTSSSSAAIGGTNTAPWYQGDTVVAGGDARLDDAAIPGQAFASNLTAPPVLIAGLIVLGVVLWRRMSK